LSRVPIPRAGRILLFYLLPVLLLVLSGIFLMSPDIARELAGTWIFPVFLILTFLVCGVSVILRVLLDQRGQKYGILKEEYRAAIALRRTREGQLRTLRSDVELLSAIREIGVIVNADDELGDVISKVLEVVGGVVKASDMILYLIDKDSRNLEPVARRIEGKTRIFRGLRKPPTAPGRITEAIEHRRLLKDFVGGTPVFTLPLVVERETVGALKVTLELDEEGEDAVEQIEGCERLLRGLERHLALAIKTPSLYHRAVVDGLTGLYSRRHFDNQMAGYFLISQRRGSPLGYILADIDHFKQVNDNFGHPTGDAVLREVARVILREIREYDSAYRYGGEELCIILPQTGLEDAYSIAERIRTRVEKKKFTSDRRKRVPVTLSLGVAAHSAWMKEPADLIARADRALYDAKGGGRNRTVRAELAAGKAEAPPAGKKKGKKRSRPGAKKAKKKKRARKKKA
jgi:diguanylate cyclase (GGDEF)-like protein